MGTLYQQNHVGVYRLTTAVSNGLTSVRTSNRFGFAIGITRDGGVYVVPQDEEQVLQRPTDGLPHPRRRTELGRP
jgi:hypothetical protein